MNKLTEMEQNIYDFICNFSRQYGYAPSFKEIGEGVYLCSLNAVSKYLGRLIDKGVITYTPYISRSIVIRKEVS